MNLDVVFRNNNHEKLVGTLSYPLGKEKIPGVILCHGFAANKELLFFPDLADELVNKGFAVLRFDCRACGSSEGMFHPTYKTMVEDVQAAISFMKGQERVMSVSLAGHSMGGTSVIMAASLDDAVKAVVSFAAVANPYSSAKKKKDVLTLDGDHYIYTSSLGDSFIFTEDWFVDAGKIKPVEAVTKIKVPVMIIHGTADDRVSVADAKQLFSSASFPKSINVIDGEKHFFKNSYDSLINSTTRFFEMWLKKKE